MNSPFANIFLAIQQQIKTAVPAITYIDQDMGQLKSGSRPPVSWPCVLVDFEEFDFQNMGENVQTAKGTVVLKLGFAPHSNTNQLTPQPYVQQAISFYDTEWALHQAMQGWSPGDDYGRLCRTSTKTQQRNDSYRVREIRYSIAFEDYSTQAQVQYAGATLVVTDEIEAI